MDAFRERFREGAEDYRAGRYAEAIVKWESIYAELGTQQGYRLAFNLGRAYDATGKQPLRAAQRYQAYLDEVAKRRQRGMSLEPNVVEQENEANARIAELAKVLARITVLGGQATTIANIDDAEPRIAEFSIYVEPGVHRVTFGTEPQTVRIDVDVKAGETRVVSPPAPAPEPLPPPARYETRVEHPFGPVVLWIAGGAAVAASVVTVITVANALASHDTAEGGQDSIQDATVRQNKLDLQTNYNNAKAIAYASEAAAGFVVTAAVALGAWYMLGKKEVRVPIAPQARVGSRDANVGLSVRF
jgi:hypothetical protein